MSGTTRADVMDDRSNDGAVALYDRSVANGHYELDGGGLYGKHDNVRRYWEDDLSRHFLRPALRTILDRHYWAANERIRIFDLGCGSGQGYELITSVTLRDPNVYEHAVELLPPYLIGRYVGCDISEGMLTQARAIYGNQGKFDFRQADFGDGLPVAPDDPPFHLYFSSYGSLSHIPTEGLISLLREMGRHARAGGFIILDLLGRYSYEWPCYWDRPAGPGEDMWDYSMSYLPGEDPSRSDTWPMRYWSLEEVRDAVAQACEGEPFELRVTRSFDRSLFVGRHIDTCEYNPHAPRLRQAVNRLHESNVRTDLTELLFDFVPAANNPLVAECFERLHVAWNSLVHFCLDKLSTNDDNGEDHVEAAERMLPGLKQGVLTMNRLIDNVNWMEMGDPRANIIEPQLGYALRGVEAGLQQGSGLGHGLLVAVEVAKPS